MCTTFDIRNTVRFLTFIYKAGKLLLTTPEADIFGSDFFPTQLRMLHLPGAPGGPGGGGGGAGAPPVGAAGGGGGGAGAGGPMGGGGGMPAEGGMREEK